MQAVHVRPGGAPAIVEVPVPELRAGEVLVRIAAAAVNPVDAFTAAGGPRDAGWAAPDAVLGLGWDLAGEVVAVGDGAAIAPGTRVAAIVADPTVATFAEYVALPAADVAPIPDGIGTVDAAALPLASLTAAQALDLVGEPGGDLLITGAAGAVGGFAVPLAVRAGWTVTGLARPADAEGVRDAGAEAATGLTGGYDAALDTACQNAYLAESLRGLRLHLGRLRRLARNSPGRLADSAREHADIARAIASGDPELAAASTLVHLRRALAHLQDAGIPTDPAASADPARQEATA